MIDRVLMARDWQAYEGTWTAFLLEHDVYYDCKRRDYFRRSVRDAAIEKRRANKNPEYQRRYHQRHRKELNEKQRQRRKLEKSRTVQAEPVYPANRTGKLEVT